MYNSSIPALQYRYLGIAGDWHGEGQWMRIAIQTFAKSGLKTIVQLGDFGLMNDIQKLCYRINKMLVKHDMTLLIIPGNHENYDWINDDKNFVIDKFGIRWVSIYNNSVASRMGLLPRGFMWTQYNRNIMALGGASSIDFTHRTKNKDWWDAENITEGEADKIISKIDENIDIMFTHDAPRDVMALNKFTNATNNNWTNNERAYSETSRVYLDKVFRVAQPSLLMHGHWHLYVDEQGEFESHWKGDGSWSDEIIEFFSSRIVGLHMNGSVENLAVLDVKKLEVFMLSKETELEINRKNDERRMFEG